ncbi:MAG: hypothetical protein IKZ93_10230, partial [Prevotella sp.]|nr:hypothetical protein [Prevotella sp.]
QGSVCTYLHGTVFLVDGELLETEIRIRHIKCKIKKNFREITPNYIKYCVRNGDLWIEMCTFGSAEGTFAQQNKEKLCFPLVMCSLNRTFALQI